MRGALRDWREGRAGPRVAPRPPAAIGGAMGPGGRGLAEGFGGLNGGLKRSGRLGPPLSPLSSARRRHGAPGVPVAPPGACGAPRPPVPAGFWVPPPPLGSLPRPAPPPPRVSLSSRRAPLMASTTPSRGFFPRSPQIPRSSEISPIRVLLAPARLPPPLPWYRLGVPGPPRPPSPIPTPM